MKSLSMGIAFFFATCLAVLTACGGGEGESKLEQALESVTENDLAIMVLAQEELRGEFADFEVTQASGFVDNEEAAADTIDPEDTADDLELAGRINGYKLGYEAPDFFSPLEAGEGVMTVGTIVHLFKDAGAASDFVAKEVDDSLRLEGEEIEAGLTLEKVETFAVAGLADEAIGLRGRASFGDVQMYRTVVAFRLDRLVGWADVGRADDANVNSQVEAIARALEQRIEGVLLGDIGGVPVPVPQAEEEEGTPAAAASPTATVPATLIPTPEAFGAPSEPTCQFPEDITSYRYTMEASMEELTEDLEGAAEGEEGLGAALAELFGGFLMAFMQGATVEGAYVAPDRSWDKMTLGGKPFAEVIQIGDRSWFRMGEMDWTESGAELPSQEEGLTSQVSVTVSSPTELLCEAGPVDLMSTVPGLETEKETVNGVKAVHYHIDEADLQLLAALFGEGEGIEEIPESATGTMDIWLAEDGNWPVRLEGEIHYTDEEGRSITFDVFIEIKDINDPDIEIEPPI